MVLAGSVVAAGVSQVSQSRVTEVGFKYLKDAMNPKN